ncbi:MAG: DciA family protein, partial [Xanthobacteraceae bacterium]
MNKPAKRGARPLGDFLGVCLSDAFARQGFASAELVTRWTEIVGAEIAAHAEPIKVQWPKTANEETAQA